MTITLNKTMIFVKFRKEGIHKYPIALTDPMLATNDEYDVSFLGYPHRHIFHFTVSIEVFHDDRDIEFIQFKRWLEELYSEKTLELDYKSCEMIAIALAEEINKVYPKRAIEITVSEDGENGATLTFTAGQYDKLEMPTADSVSSDASDNVYLL